MSVRAWGCTDFGALGMGTGSDENLLPTEVTQTLESRNIEGVAAGDSHSIAWDTRGNVYTWGRNKEGQLGHGFRDPPRVPTPQLVQGLRHERIIGAAAGPSHTLCYTQQGALYAFGAHHKRVQDTEVLTFFGRGREMPEHKRRMILKSHVSYFNAEHMEPSEEERPDATQEGEGEQETSGGGVTALVEAAQEAGEGVRQQMTLPSHADQRGGTFQRQVRAEPWRVPLPSTSPVVHVAAGHSFSAVVTQRGELLTWGYNDKGQLGHGDRHTRDEAEVVRGLPPMASVSCGEQHCVAVARDGSVWGAGLNVFGQLGLGDREDRLSFSRLPSLPSSPSSSPHAARPAEEGAGGEGRGGGGGVKAVACGLYHTVLLSSASQVLVCGHREYGQQGEATDQGETEDGMGRSQSVVTPRILPLAPALLPSDAPPLDPAALAALPPVRVKSIASGALHSMAVTEDGRLVTWGWGGTGSLGHGWGERMGRRFAATPARQVEALRGERVLRAVGGRRHTLALTQSAWRSGLASEVGSLLTGAAKGRWDDVVFKVNNASVEACRSVLQARSPRLGAAIAFASSRFNPCAPKHPSSGPARIQLTLPGVRSEAGLRALLTFLYTDSLNVPPSRAREVKALALTYRLPRLAALCQQTMDAAEENAPPPPPALVSGEGAEGHVGEGHEGLGASLLALREGFPVAADIMLVAGGAPELPPLYAHKCILAARCEFFATAFDSLFVEGSGPSSSSSSASSSSSLQAFALGLDDELADALLALEPPAEGEGTEGGRVKGQAQWEAMEGVLDWVYGGQCGVGVESSWTRCIFTLRIADELFLRDLHEAVESVLQHKLLLEADPPAPFLREEAKAKEEPPAREAREEATAEPEQAETQEGTEEEKEEEEEEEGEEESFSMAELLLTVADRFSCPRLAACARALLAHPLPPPPPPPSDAPPLDPAPRPPLPEALAA